MLPRGAPDPGAPPCIRQRLFALTAGDLQGLTPSTGSISLLGRDTPPKEEPPWFSLLFFVAIPDISKVFPYYFLQGIITKIHIEWASFDGPVANFRQNLQSSLYFSLLIWACLENRNSMDLRAGQYSASNSSTRTAVDLEYVCATTSGQKTANNRAHFVAISKSKPIVAVANDPNGARPIDCRH